MGQWIWKFGDYEMYHNLLLHNRRQQYGYAEPPVWKMYTPETAVRFKKKVTTSGGTFRIHACGDTAVTIGNHYPDIKKFGGKKEITLEPGTTEILILVSNIRTFPCIYIEGVIESDKNWLADDCSGNFEPVGTYDRFMDPAVTPEIFPFSYEKISYISKVEIDGGLLFDFGKETFAKTILTGFCENTAIQINFGESMEEALDPEWSVVHFKREPENGILSFPPAAFRYIFVGAKEADIEAEYEYLPLEKKGAFTCTEEIVGRVWDTAVYTFHLNSREFFLDGIKRDRWVWSADAYQSFYVSHYLFLDPEIEKRTLIALGGKKPFVMHINNIVDYSFFWIISIYEYYKTYGDTVFLSQIYPQMKEVMDFCRNRTDLDGFLRGRGSDWIFIDWAPMDKTGAVCGEQILYAKAMECYAAVCGVIEKPEEGFYKAAKELQENIFTRFYDAEKGVFIDSFESGKQNVTRHSNILAYLFLPCSEKQKQEIYQNVVLNDEVAQITTPYFKFYENQVHCEAGNDNLLEKSIREYYGSMLSLGATSLYEAYDSTMQGAEHYAMYGNPYEKSLCHAWSASPVYLLGAYRLGVKNTGIAYESFEVRPNPGDLASFSGVVPVPVRCMDTGDMRYDGKVEVAVETNLIRVKATVPGGTLVYKGSSAVLKPGEEIVIPR